MTTNVKEVGVKLAYKESGAEAAKKNVQKLMDLLGKAKPAAAGFTEYEKALARSARQTQKLTVDVTKLNQVFQRVADQRERAAKAAERQAVAETRRHEREERRATKERDREQKRQRSEEEYRRKQEELAERGTRRRSFGMGLAQGLGIGEYFPEKGLGWNIAGRALGGAARWGAGAAAVPFTGMAGFQQALGGIPVVGGWMAGQIQTGAAYAGKYLAAERQMLGMARYWGAAGGLGRARRTAGQRAARGVPVAGMNPQAAALAGELAAQDAALLQEGSLSTLSPRQRHQARYARGMEALRRGGVEEAARVSGAYAAEGLVGKLETPEEARARATAAETAAQARMREESLDRRERARQAAERRVREEPFEFLKREGRQYGMEPTAARQAGGEFMEALGGTFRQIAPGGRARELLQTGMAAQVFGIDMSTTAAFARGGKTGAMGPGTSGQGAFFDAMRDAVRLGLQGSDLTNYMAQVAGDIRNFESTGMPLAQESLARMQGALAPAMGGYRDAAVSRGILAAAQGVAEQGPQTAAQFLMLQEMGGFRGGGVKAYFQAQRQLRTGGGREGLERFLKRAQILGSPEGNALAVQDLLGQLGAKVNEEEALAYVGGNKEYLYRWAGALAEGRKEAEGITPEGFAKEAKAAVPRGVARAAGMAGAEEATGRAMLGVVQDLEETSRLMTGNFAKFSSQIGLVTTQIEKAAVASGPLFDSLKELIDKLVKAIPEK